MKNFGRIALFVSITICLLLFTNFASAQGLVQCGNPGQPACNLCSLLQLVATLINFAIATGTAFVGLFITWGAFVTMTAGGDEGRVKQGREILTTAITGLVIMLTAWLVLGTIVQVLSGAPNKLPWTEIRCTTTSSSGASATTGSLQGSQPVTTTKAEIAGGTQDHSSEADGSNLTFKRKIDSSLATAADQADTFNANNTSVIVSKSGQTMTIYRDGQEVAQIPVNVGKGDLSGTQTGGISGDKITPVGEFTVTSDKRIDATNGVYDQTGKYNMGAAFIGTSATDQNGAVRGIGIHSNASDTLTPTAGCIRVSNNDALALYKILQPGMKIKIQN